MRVISLSGTYDLLKYALSGVACCALVTGVSAATLTIKDDDGTETVTLSSTDYLVLQSYGNGNTLLTVSGFTLTAGASTGSGTSSGSSGTSGGSSGTSGGSSGTSGGSSGTSGGSSGTSGGSTGTSGGSTGTSGGSTGTGGGDGAGGSASSDTYCSGADQALVSCSAAENFDPWIASTGEKPYWVTNKLTKSFPFTTATDADSEYGYLQITTFERNRDKYTEDIFHIWFSETPNGPALDGVKCEYYATQARLNLYWSQDEKYADQVCFLGTGKRVLYVNAETRCSPSHYKGTCDDENKRKSAASYNFDVARATQ